MAGGDKIHRGPTNKTLQVQAGRYYVYREPSSRDLPKGCALRLVSDDGEEELRPARTFAADRQGRTCIVFEDIEASAKYTLSWLLPNDVELVIFSGAPGSQLLSDEPASLDRAPYGEPLSLPAYSQRDAELFGDGP